MPDNNARVQLWKSVGGCVPMNASQYFRTVINFAERLKIPASLTSSTNVEMQQSALRQQFVRLNRAYLKMVSVLVVNYHVRMWS